MYKNNFYATDDELIYQLRLKDEIALRLIMERYTPHIHIWIKDCLKGFPIFSYDKKDLLQLSWIAFFDAIDAYWEEYGIFYSFAKLLVTRQIYSALRSSRNTGIVASLNDVSLDIPLYDDTNETLLDRMESNLLLSNPKSYYLLQEVLDILNDESSDVLTSKERIAVKLKMSGYSSQEIAEKLKLTDKAADNVVRRGRKKLQEFVNYD